MGMMLRICKVCRQEDRRGCRNGAKWEGSRQVAAGPSLSKSLCIFCMFTLNSLADVSQ
jgi:hypothetical protein